MQDGILVFCVYPDPHENTAWDISEAFSYELTFFDGNGAVLAVKKQ